MKLSEIESLYKEKNLIKQAEKYFSSDFPDYYVLKEIGLWLEQFIGEESEDFKSPLDKLAVNLPIVVWLNAARRSPIHSSAAEIALRKIEIEIHGKINLIPHGYNVQSFDCKDLHFKDICQNDFGLSEEQLIVLYFELQKEGRVPIYYGNERRSDWGDTLGFTKRGKSHAELWRRFPTAVTLFAVACALYKINSRKYLKFIKSARSFVRDCDRILYCQLVPLSPP